MSNLLKFDIEMVDGPNIFGWKSELLNKELKILNIII